MDWSNIVSLAFSAIGCVTGCAALVQTHNANKIAEKSLGIGEAGSRADDGKPGRYRFHMRTPSFRFMIWRAPIAVLFLLNLLQ